MENPSGSWIKWPYVRSNKRLLQCDKLQARSNATVVPLAFGKERNASPDASGQYP
jgi:hypothetical protein